MESTNSTVPPQEPEKDFNYYVSCVTEVTRQFDFAIANQTEDGVENGLLRGNMEALQQCQSMSEELLADFGMPLEHRLLLQYYMSACQSLDTRIIYLKLALGTAELLESIDNNTVEDPMREILEEQLRFAENEKAAQGNETDHLSHPQMEPDPSYGSSVNLPPDSITPFGGTFAPMHLGSTSESHNNIAGLSMPPFGSVPPTQPRPVIGSYNDVSRNSVTSFADFANAQPGHDNEYFNNYPNALGAPSISMPPGSSVDHGGGTPHTPMANYGMRPGVNYGGNTTRTPVGSSTLKHQRRDKRDSNRSSGTRGTSLAPTQHRLDHDYTKNSFGGYIAPVAPMLPMSSSEAPGYDNSTGSASFAHLQPVNNFNYTKNTFSCLIAPSAPTLPSLGADDDDDDDEDDVGNAPRNHLTPVTPPRPEQGYGSLENPSQNPSTTAKTWRPTPWVILSELSPPSARRHAVLKARLATARRQRKKAMPEEQSEQGAEIE